MADIDADLLALAGDSSDDEQDAGPSAATRADPPSPASSRGSSVAGDRSPGGAAVTPNRRARHSTSGGGRSAKGRNGDSEEEGEAISSASSLRSASMSQSESDQDTFDSEAAGLSQFPIEGKYTSMTDKAEIEALPEVKREEILADRATIVERENQKQTLMQIWQSKEREKNQEAERKKRKAGAADLDEQRKSTRQKTTLGGRKVGETSKPLEEYKRQREQRGVHNEQRRRDDDRKQQADRRRDDRHSDADADGESDGYEWDDGRARNGARRSSSSEAREQLPATLRDFERAKVGRTGFAKVCFYPGFEEAVAGSIVRISIGMDKGQNIYRLGQIKKFTEGKPYAMETENGKRFVTNQYALARHGLAEKEWPFIVLSNSPLTEAELERYTKTCAAESVTVLTKAYLDKKVDDLNKLLNRSWTEEEIQTKLRRSGVLAAKDAPLKRIEIQKRRQIALDQGREDEIAQCDAELAALAGPKLAFGTSLSASPSRVRKGPTQQERLAELNRANRRANTEDIRRAQLAEKEAEAREAAAIARGEAIANPFARVKTRAKVMHDVNSHNLVPPKPSSQGAAEDGSSDVSRGATPLSGANTPVVGALRKRQGTPSVLRLSDDKPKGIPTIRRRAMDDEIIGAMDLGIDIEI